ncbi:MAG: InlB B-repeat-containing protein [Butyrivibrio sp.]|nr:InlB B-repeat-containing protein [Butyrivibrio sp.]
MIKRVSGKILSLVLAAAMTVSFCIPSYASDITEPVADNEVVVTADSNAGGEASAESSVEADNTTEDYTENKDEQIPSDETSKGTGDEESADNNENATEVTTDADEAAAAEATAEEETGETELLALEDEDKLVGSNEVLTISINYANVDYDTPATFPEGVELPQSVQGRAGEVVYFMVPSPIAPEGKKVQMIKAIAPSCISSGEIDGVYYDTIWNYLHGVYTNNQTYMRFEYSVSEEDVEEGITVSFDILDIIEVVFVDGDHGRHYFGSAGPREYSAGDYFFGDGIYPGFSPNMASDFLYYEPNYGYRFVGVYRSPDFSEDSVLYLPEQNQGTEITGDLLTFEDGKAKLYAYAKWEPIEADVFLNYESTDYKVKFGETLPEFTGHSSLRYYVRKYGEGEVNIVPGETVFDENIQYTAEKDDYGNITGFSIYVIADNRPVYDVSFVTGTEAEIESVKVVRGKCVNKPEKELEKEGYYLAGWYTDEACTKAFVFGKTAINADTTLYAKWVPIKYEVAFHTNYGKDTVVKRTFTLADPEEMRAVVLDAEEIFGESGNYGILDDWTTSGELEFSADVTGGVLVDKLYETYGMPSAVVKLDLYAQWKAQGAYTVVFDANLPADAKAENLSGSFVNAADLKNADPTQMRESYNLDESVVLYGNEYTLKGFTFAGWKYVKNDKTVNVKPAATVKPNAAADEEITFKAQWKKVGSYKITYKLSGGTAGKNKTTKTYKADSDTIEGLPLYNYVKNGDTYDLNTETPEVTRNGYTFTGWTAGEKSYTYYGDDVYENLTLTAQWEADPYSLEFVYDGEATLPGKVEVADFNGAYAVKDFAASKAGYTFKGWIGTYKGKSKLFSVKNVIRLKDLDAPADKIYKLTASFTPNKYKITYKLDGGKISSAPSSYRTDIGSSKAVPVPRKTGYSFAGWTATVTDGAAPSYTIDTINEIIDSETGKIKAGTYGRIELSANWDPYTYDIEFYDCDGELYGTIDGYTDIGYTQNIDLTAAAIEIEKTVSDENTGIKGFALAAGKRTAKYSLYKNYSKLGAKSSDGVVKLYAVKDTKTYRITYDGVGGTITKPVNFYKYSEKKDVKITAAAQKKGYKFVGWTSDNTEDVILQNGHVTAIRRGAKADIELTADFEVIRYTVTLMPNATDAKLASGDAISNKDGVRYVENKNGVETAEFEYTTDKTLDLPDWTRQGYTLVGFAASAKSKEPVTSLKELSYGKNNNVKLYAIWEGMEYTITYAGEAFIYNPFTGSSYIEAEELAGSEKHVYMGSDVTPKTVSLDGYEFKGWKAISVYEPEKSSVTFRQGDYKNELDGNVYISKIKKDNASDITLLPVFMEEFCSVYVNHNGGYDDNSYYMQPEQDLLTVVNQYTGDISADLEKYYQSVKRAGYVVDYLSTTKDGKGKINLYSTVDGKTVRNPIIGLAKQNKFKNYNVTIYPIWKKVTPATPTASAAFTDEGLTMKSSIGAYGEFSSVVFEYSPSPIFLYGVKSVTVTPAKDETKGVAIVTGLPEGRNYYVRVKYGMKDSTGDYTYGSFSKSVRASR